MLFARALTAAGSYTPGHINVVSGCLEQLGAFVAIESAARITLGQQVAYINYAGKRLCADVYQKPIETSYFLGAE